MKKVLLGLFTILLATFGFGGISMADTTVTHHTENVVPGTYTLNGNTGFTAGTITVRDGATTITILDRNLGATTAGTGCEDRARNQNTCAQGDSTYGYHFQWGNNYGFPSVGVLPNTQKSTTQVESGSITIPYSSSVFISVSDWNWLNDDIFNLWGGSKDDSIDVNNDAWKVTNATERKGPCPDGFHVPSIGELRKLSSMFNNDGATMYNKLLIPFAGYRASNDAASWNVGHHAFLLSSTPYSTNMAKYLQIHIDGSNGSTISYDSYSDNYRANAYSVRCFYNDYTEYGVSAPTEITEINISGITDPVLGETATVDGISIEPTEGIELNTTTNWGPHWRAYANDDGNKDCPLSGNNSYSRCSPTFTKEDAHPEKYYYLRLAYTPKAGYSMADNYTVTFNGSGTLLESDYDTSNNFYYIKIKYPVSSIQEQAPTPTTYTITWKNGDTILKTGTVAEGATPAYSGDTPTKAEDSSCTYTFDKWTPDLAPATGNTTYTATFTCTAKQSSSSPSTSSGGKTVKKDKIDVQTDKDTEKEDTKNNDKEDNNEKDNSDTPMYEQGDQSEVLDNGYTREFNNAYRFGLKYGITTMDDINKADMHGPLTRIAMDKMLVNYAINVLHMVPDTTREVPNFPDIDEKLNEEYGNAVTLGYQLGIMGINITEFRPFDEVPRSDFGTSLGRMLFGLEDGEGLYYEPHLKKLKEKGIITNDDPNLQELRGYVMIMLMRSAM